MVRDVTVAVVAVIVAAGCDPRISQQGEDLSEEIRPVDDDGNDSSCPVCPAGYTPVGTECVWYGGPRNGDFVDLSAWETRGAVVIDPDAMGIDGPGAAIFAGEALCEGATLRQSFEMPSYECSEPLALVLNTASTCEFCFPSLEMNVDINRGRTRLIAGNVGEPFEICLGERAYGQTANLEISTVAADCTFGGGEVIVDDVDVWPALSAAPTGPDADESIAVCAPPGTIVNGDFEAGMPGWFPESDAAEVATGHGVAGTLGVRLFAKDCEPARIRGTASLPMHETTPNPAVELWVHGSGEDAVVLSYGDHALGAVTTSGPQVHRLCIPRWAQGVTEPLTVSAQSHGSGCVQPRTDYRVDGLTTVSESTCVQDRGVFDGGFEQLAIAQVASSWWRSGTAVPTTEAAYEGNASLMLELGGMCEAARAHQTITVPAGAPKPAIRFFYRTEGGGSFSAQVRGQALPPTNGEWMEHVICLEPQAADAPEVLDLAMQFQGGACGGATARVYFDAVEVLETTTRSCL